MSTQNGNLIENRTGYGWRAVVTYTVNTSYSNTQVQIKASLAFTAYGNLGQVGSAIESANVSLKGGGTAHGSYTKSSWTINKTSRTLIAEQTWYVNKGTSAATHNVVGSITVSNSSAWKGTSTATVAVTIPAKPSYSVTYNANGGTGAPGTQTKWYGTNLTLSSTKPTKTGYTFVGWNTSASATTASYQPGATYTANAALSLYAIWKKTITLSYNSNGGSTAPSSQSATVYNGTSSYTFTLSATRLTRTGYDFLGWSTSASATAASYQPGGTITISSNTTLYAVWKRKPVYVKISGAWKSGYIYVKKNGTWHEAKAVSVKEDGTWHTL